MKHVPSPAARLSGNSDDARHVDYMAKDYDSFRALMLQRMAEIVPDWEERHAADLGVAIIEVLAYAGDLLSYRQDAIALEAYLDTAVDRVSVQRLTRLLGYRLSNGCNARALVVVQVQSPSVTIPAGTMFTTELPQTGAAIPPDVFGELKLFEQSTVFESMLLATLRDVHNEITVHQLRPDGQGAWLTGKLDQLEVGSILLLSRLTAGGSVGRADHAVRITAVEIETAGTQFQLTYVEWHADDLVGDTQGSWVATANTVLVDHGRTLFTSLSSIATRRDRFRIDEGGLTSCEQAPAEDASAFRLLQPQNPNLAVPAVVVDTPGGRWVPAPDLLGAGRFDRRFAVETHNDGAATLRFGDGRNGRAQPDSRAAEVAYRVGNGVSGNLSANEISRVVTDVSGVMSVANPIPAQGGVDPETIEKARLFAPVAHEYDINRCVTAADYGAAARLVQGVHRAAARVESNGARANVDVFVELDSGIPEAIALSVVAQTLAPLQAIGHDVDVRRAHYLHVDIEICLYLDHPLQRTSVEADVRRALGTAGAPIDPHAFFAPGRFSFGERLRISDLLSAVHRVPGVEAAEIHTMRRIGAGDAPPADITPAPWEIIRAGDGDVPTVALKIGESK